jgi:heme a synthase
MAEHIDVKMKKLSQNSTRSHLFVRAAWSILAYNLGVVCWGAWVRISNSGNGCGKSWPTCHGRLIPQSAQESTWIEFSHRLTSGFTLLAAIVLVVWARRIWGRQHPATRWAWVSLIFIVLEALLGALLVLQGLVAEDASLARAVVVAIHLVNTFGLLGSGALCAWYASNFCQADIKEDLSRVAVVILLGSLLVTGASGAITALGDTLFPVSPSVGEGLFAHLRADLSLGEHFLVRLRIVHPLVAVMTFFTLWILLLRYQNAAQDKVTRLLHRVSQACLVFQMVIGVLNISLGAPGWMQIVHLLAADILWLSLLLWVMRFRVPTLIERGDS